jgi:hypothetical protein
VAHKKTHGDRASSSSTNKKQKDSMMVLKLGHQPQTGTVNFYLSPRLTAKLTSDRPGGTVGGTYSATASLLDCAGNPLQGILSGYFNTTGQCNPAGTEVNFCWDWLSIGKPGLYQLQVTVLELAPDLSMCIHRASATTDVIDIAAK